MITTLLQALAVAALGIPAPISITLVILFLMSSPGWRNGQLFALGYTISYAIIGTLVLLFGGNSVELLRTEPTTTRAYVLIALSVVLMAIAIRNLYQQQTATDDSASQSRFSSLIGPITPAKSFAIAAAVSVINVKNLALFLSAVSVLLLGKMPLPNKLLMLPLVVLTFSMSVIIPVAIYRLYPDKAETYLTWINTTISRYSRPIGIALTFLLSIFFVYRGLAILN